MCFFIRRKRCAIRQMRKIKSPCTCRLDMHKDSGIPAVLPPLLHLSLTRQTSVCFRIKTPAHDHGRVPPQSTAARGSGRVRCEAPGGIRSSCLSCAPLIDRLLSVHRQETTCSLHCFYWYISFVRIIQYTTKSPICQDFLHFFRKFVIPLDNIRKMRYKYVV